MDKERLKASAWARVIEIDLKEIRPGPILSWMEANLHGGIDPTWLPEGILRTVEEPGGQRDIRVPVVLDHEVQELIGGGPGEDPVLHFAGNDEGMTEFPVGEQPADVGRDSDPGLGHLIQPDAGIRLAGIHIAVDESSAYSDALETGGNQRTDNLSPPCYRVTSRFSEQGFSSLFGRACVLGRMTSRNCNSEKGDLPLWFYLRTKTANMS